MGFSYRLEPTHVPIIRIPNSQYELQPNKESPSNKFQSERSKTTSAPTNYLTTASEK